ncbi:neuromedin-U [Rhinophrynus dorsalis]
MLSPSGCKERPALHSNVTEGRSQSNCLHNFRRQPPCGLLLVIFLLAAWTTTCKGVPLSSHTFRAEQELQLWDGLDDACSEILSDSQPVGPSTLEELCFMVMGILQRPQDSEEKDNTKRFLFHYSKSHDSGNSDITSSVLHPLLQLVPQLHDRRMKRFKAEEELQGPGGVLSRGYFLFRPRNGRRSAGFR